MKERIVIDNNQHLPRASYYVAKDGHYDVGTVNYATPETILNENRIVAVKEQVPETFEELKELCKGIKGVEYAGGNAKGEIIEISNIWFAENGEIWGYTDDFTGICNISKDRTPQQMWQIIKSLIGEE